MQYLKHTILAMTLVACAAPDLNDAALAPTGDDPAGEAELAGFRTVMVGFGGVKVSSGGKRAGLQFRFRNIVAAYANCDVQTQTRQLADGQWDNLMTFIDRQGRPTLAECQVTFSTILEDDPDFAVAYRFLTKADRTHVARSPGWR